MSAILKFDFQTSKQLRFSEVNYLNCTKRPNVACDNYIFPKTSVWSIVEHAVQDSGSQGREFEPR